MTGPLAANSYCRNCEFFLGETPVNYCAHCGQATMLHPPPAGVALRQFVQDYLSPRGKLMRSLALLLFRPGELTHRYLIGKRNSHIAPLRLYVATSLVFFLVAKVFGSGDLFRADAVSGPPSTVSTQSSADGKKPGGLTIRRATREDELRLGAVEQGMDTPFMKTFYCGETIQCNKLRDYMQDKYGDASLRTVGRQVRDRLIGYAPNAMFVMLPFFALMTKLLYWRRRLVYGEHMAYAMHVHAFSYLLLLAMAVVTQGFAQLLFLAGMVYFALAMRRVFGGRWWATLIRYTIIGIGYPILLSIAILATLLAAVFI